MSWGTNNRGILLHRPDNPPPTPVSLLMETTLYITVCTHVIHLGQSSITGHALFMQKKAVQLGDAGLFYLHRCAAVGQATLQAKYSRSHQCSVEKKLLFLITKSYFYGVKCCCCFYYRAVMTPDIHIWHLWCLTDDFGQICKFPHYLQHYWRFWILTTCPYLQRDELS